MKMYRCRICGETHLGYAKPSNCPFCGAHEEHIVISADYRQTAINDVELTEAERADVLAAIELERGNARFYFGMASHKDNDALSSAYKRLATIEAEHCSVFCKLARVPKPEDLLLPAKAADDWCTNIEKSLTRERKASAFYADVVARASNDRIREVFSAVSAVEADHIELDNVAKGYAGCN
jgi:rubrerythrin